MKGQIKRKALTIALTIAALAAAVFVVVKFVKISPEPEDSLTSSAAGTDAESTVTAELSIDFSIVYEDKYYPQLSEGLKAEGALPESGHLTENAAVSIKEDKTVLDVLIRYCSENSIELDYETAEQNAYGSAYVKGIGGLYEGDCTMMSGWGYTVNGESPEVGMDDYKLEGGEHITIEYIIFE